VLVIVNCDDGWKKMSLTIHNVYIIYGLVVLWLWLWLWLWLCWSVVLEFGFSFFYVFDTGRCLTFDSLLVCHTLHNTGSDNRNVENAAKR